MFIYHYHWRFLQHPFINNIVYFLFSLIILSSCQKSAADNSLTVTVAQTIKNLTYGKDTAQKMDVYLPANRTTSTTRILVLIHGGGWIGGNKADFQPYADSLEKRLPNYAIFNINYRLATYYTNLYPTQEDDVKAAMAFIYGKRDEYHISDNIILLGASAGGNLALLQAYKQTLPVRAKAVIDFFGPTDMKALYQAADKNMQSALEIFLGGNPTSNPGNYTNASPVNFITPQAPPTLILYGSSDRTVPPAQNTLLQAKLQEAGVANKVVVYPLQGHGWHDEKLADSFNQIAAFLDQHI